MLPTRLPDFVGVAAGGTATLKLPKNAQTVGKLQLVLGGTTFTKAHIADIKVKIGPRVVWNAQTQGANAAGTHLDRINSYRGLYSDAYHLEIDFSEPWFKTVGACEIGGVDMTKFAEDVFIEVQILGTAVAPTMYAILFFVPPQGSADDPLQLVQKLVAVPWAATAAGRFTIPFEPRGSLIKRAYVMFNGTAGTAVADGNISKIEVKKNGLTMYDPNDRENRFAQQCWKRVPQANMYVVDFTMDNNLSGTLPTADAASLEFIMSLTAADQGIAYFEVLDPPFNL